jgi:small subunit ribosomal protein S20
MAHSSQARKRARQNEKARERNKSVRNEIKTLTKTLKQKISAKDVEGAKSIFLTVVSKLDKAAKRHIFHRNTVARAKSTAAQLINSLGK